MTDQCRESKHDQWWCWIHDSEWKTGEDYCEKIIRMNEAAEEMRRQDRETTEHLKHLIQTMRGVQ